MNRSFAVLASSFLVLGAAACDKSAADAQEKADKAQAQANTEITSAQTTADDKARNAQATADKKIAEAQSDFNKTREDYRHTTQSNLDALDKKVADLDAKAKTAAGSSKADLMSRSTSLHAQRDAFAADFKSLDSASVSTWDATKARLDKEWSDLKAAADKAT